ncbi:MAG TPA: arginine--tRNA ligase [Candidatus Dormibacteraeota bacterium]|nr:arginine--tRNA ligase [Candidatus Dormibacteraeota bacterium]
MPDIPGLLTRAVDEALEAMGAGEIAAAIERSARPEFGDWSTPAPLRAARVLRRPPPVIAEELRGILAARPLELVRAWSVSGGYVNAHLDDATWAPAVIADALALDPSAPVRLSGASRPPSGKTLIEHTNINTNKAAHVGHLRNACIGDTVARVLRRIGTVVEVNNFIDDTGVQVADVVVGIRELGLQPAEGEPFDQFCSRVYVEVCRRYETRPDLLARRTTTLHDIEARHNEIADFAKDMAKRIVAAHLATMRRFDIGYDLLTWESDILELGFWRTAFQLLRDSGAIVLADSGRNKGCWVMPWVDEDRGGDDLDDDDRSAKVLVKSDGVATYTAKDIAYQMWKFGLLGLDFHYTAWDAGDPQAPATTSAEPSVPDLDDRGYGRAARVVNVIDARQAYLQQVVKQALARIGHPAQAEASVHLAYEVVALSADAARDLGVEVDEGKNIVALSGRRGIEVRADDLLDLAVTKVRDKARDESGARSLAAGAVRYYLQKFSLSQIIAFDFDEALRTTGDTGVYLQYAHARAAGILRKVADDQASVVTPAELTASERSLLHCIDNYRVALGETAAALSPTVMTTYAFTLASAFSDFYEHTEPVVSESDVGVRRFRRALVAATRATLADALSTLGIAAPQTV